MAVRSFSLWYVASLTAIMFKGVLCQYNQAG